MKKIGKELQLILDGLASLESIDATARHLAMSIRLGYIRQVSPFPVTFTFSSNKLLILVTLLNIVMMGYYLTLAYRVNNIDHTQVWQPSSGATTQDLSGNDYWLIKNHKERP